MKTTASSGLDIVIEWRCTCHDRDACSGAHMAPPEDVLELARALGRLAAERDRARALAHREHQRLSSAGKRAKVSELEPT